MQPFKVTRDCDGTLRIDMIGDLRLSADKKEVIGEKRPDDKQDSEGCSRADGSESEDGGS
jgi:hypothetical protein